MVLYQKPCVQHLLQELIFLTDLDAAIISGLTFFSTLGGGSVAGLEGLSAMKAAVIAACAQFFVFLALKRGIVQHKQVVG